MQNNPDSPWKADSNGVLLAVFVQPRSSKNQICGLQNGELKLRLTAPPVDGAANDCCREFLARLFRISRSSITIVAGEASRHKRIRLEGIDTDQCEQLLK